MDAPLPVLAFPSSNPPNEAELMNGVTRIILSVLFFGVSGALQT